jgi:hypothetical protein
MEKRKAKKVEAEAVPEVVEFLDTQRALEDFKEEHAAIFEQLHELTDRYNAAFEAAEKACRSKEMSCGPFDLYQFTTKYDPEALYNAVGRDKFLQLGGSIGTSTVYTLDKARFEICVSQNKVPEDVVLQVRKETPNFHKPEKLVIP